MRIQYNVRIGRIYNLPREPQPGYSIDSQTRKEIEATLTDYVNTFNHIPVVNTEQAENDQGMYIMFDHSQTGPFYISDAVVGNGSITVNLLFP